jgi:hypothetical protein
VRAGGRNWRGPGEGGVQVEGAGQAGQGRGGEGEEGGAGDSGPGCRAAAAWPPGRAPLELACSGAPQAVGRGCAAGGTGTPGGPAGGPSWRRSRVARGQR